MTPKQELFVAEYLVDGNATQAAIRAGYSEKTARAIGCENLTKPDIQAKIAAGRSQRVDRTGITADWVLMQQASLHAQTVTENPEVARKTLRDIGDGIGMYTEKVDHSFSGLNAEERTDRIAAILNGARQRAEMVS